MQDAEPVGVLVCYGEFEDDVARDGGCYAHLEVVSWGIGGKG